MKILRLALKNFKGIRNFAMDTQGGNVDIFGDNATGKTTLFDALTWLLFDKDSANKKDFQIKTLDASGKAFSGIDHEVEGVFEVNGRTITLRKVYAEQWTKKRGSATATFTGHTTDYFIDGVPVKKNEYTNHIAEIADESIFKLLTNSTYFNEVLHWQDRRKILLEACGDISDAEVIASDKSLSKLPDILQGRKLEDHRKVIAAKRTEINKELEKIPVRIDEVQQSLPDVTGIDVGHIDEKITFLKSRAQEKNQEIIRIQGGGQVAELTKALREAEGKILEIKNQHRSEIDAKVQGKRDEFNGLRNQVATLQQVVASKERLLQSNNSYIKDLETKMSLLRDDWHRVDSKKFEYAQDCTCPTCGQPLPEEKLTAAREKALAQFNQEKAQQLEHITSKGKQYKAEIGQVQVENELLVGIMRDAQGELDSLVPAAASLQEEIDAIIHGASDVTENPGYIQAAREKEALEQQIGALSSNNAGLIANIRAEITSLEAEIGTLERTLVQADQYKRGLERIEQLKRQEKELAAEFERLEGELYLAEQFIRSKVALLEEKINSRFKMARFKLFDTQINGGLQEVCETTYNGVPFSSLNNAARINVGLDIINTLAEHYGFDAPVFIDNAEAVVEVIPTRGQMIRLIVSGTDKKLRVECKNILREAI